MNQHQMSRAMLERVQRYKRNGKCRRAYARTGRFHVSLCPCLRCVVVRSEVRMAVGSVHGVSTIVIDGYAANA